MLKPLAQYILSRSNILSSSRDLGSSRRCYINSYQSQVRIHQYFVTIIYCLEV